jgi:NADPH:quinone reductase-like Zn-dependent oxidoreductase
VGDTVFGFLDPMTMYRHNGALAEYIVARKGFITPKPANLTNAEASGLAGVGWTAVCAGDAAGLKKGDKVLVNGGSGGLGSMLVQVAKGIVGESGKVVAVCSGRNEAVVKGLGADEVG